jgi:hypothetical protein
MLGGSLHWASLRVIYVGGPSIVSSALWGEGQPGVSWFG